MIPRKGRGRAGRMGTRLLLLAVTVAVLSRPAFAEPDRPGAWSIASATRIIDPKHILFQMGARNAHLLLSSVMPPSLQNYCVIGDEKLIDSNRIHLFDPVHCNVHGASDSHETGNPHETFSMWYACGGVGHHEVDGQITVTYDSREHYTGKTVYSDKDETDIKWLSTFEGKWVGDTCPGH
jgi:hypothetical protein